MKEFFFEFEATEENTHFHFERQNCNLEFIFGIPQTYIAKIGKESGPFIINSFIPFTAHNLGLCTVIFEISAGIYDAENLKATLKYPKSKYSEGITIEPNEYFTADIPFRGDEFGLDKIIGQVRLDCEECFTDIIPEPSIKQKNTDKNDDNI